MENEPQYIAGKRLRWGNGFIEPGEPVPANEAGRNYRRMLANGWIIQPGAQKPGTRGAQRIQQPLPAAVPSQPAPPAKQSKSASPAVVDPPKAMTAAQERAALVKEAKGLGISVRASWALPTLRGRVEAAKDDKAKSQATSGQGGPSVDVSPEAVQQRRGGFEGMTDSELREWCADHAKKNGVDLEPLDRPMLIDFAEQTFVAEETARIEAGQKPSK